MKTIDLIQGSPEWLAHRAQHFNASDAPAMMGVSSYTTRTELLTRMKTGITPDVDAGTQRRFDDGHRFEALARPLAEEIIGEDLYPMTGTEGQYSASFDGLTMMHDVAFEHKTLNEELRETMKNVDNSCTLPIQYRVQMEQQLLVSGAKKVLFMASKWDGETLIEERHQWYASDKELRAKIVAGWAQFEKDLAEFVPTEAAVKPVGKAPETLPALHIVIQGGVSASNLDEFKQTALGAIRGVNRELTTDVHFADAEKAVKWCSDIEDRIKAAKDHALSQTASIDALFRTMDEISAEARDVRLDLAKLVKARKESMKAEIVSSGVSSFAKHIRELNAAMTADYMPTIATDFGTAIKNLRTIDSIVNAVDSEVARAKIAANDVSTRIHANLKAIDAANAPMLFAYDIKTLVLKQPEDLAAIIAQRVAAEDKRKSDEREQIRLQEVARIERENAAKATAEKAESERLERQREHAVKVEADRIAREQQEAVSAQRIRDGLISKQMRSLDQAEDAAIVAIPQAAADPLPFIAAPVLSDKAVSDKNAIEFIDRIEVDNGARLTLGQINELLAPVSITVAGLASLGFEPVEQVKASRLYRDCDFPAICAAISAHVLNAVSPVAEPA